MPDGRIESLVLGNLLWEKAKFNTRLQVTELALGHGIDTGDVWKLGYEYGEIDSSGNVDAAKNTGNIARQTLSFTGLPQPFVQSYKYDSLFRLTEARETSGTGTSAPQTWKGTFGYDRYGNRTSHTRFEGATQLASSNITDPTIDPATNRFQAGQGYAFVKNGNLVTDAESRAFTFDADNKQSKVVQNGHLVAEYFFDGEGKRVKKKVYDPNNSNIVKEETVFVYSSGKLIAEYSTEPPPQNPTISYTATDQLGSPRVITNAFGEVVSRRDFKPFGEQIEADGTYRTASLYSAAGDNIRQKFTGYQKDEETNLDFAEARMYENRHGRFTAVDPLLASGKSATPQTFNRYVYMLNNPLLNTDPEGLQVATRPAGAWYQPIEPPTDVVWHAVWIKSGDPAPDGYRSKTYYEHVFKVANTEQWEVQNPVHGNTLQFDNEESALQQLDTWTGGIQGFLGMKEWEAALNSQSYPSSWGHGVAAAGLKLASVMLAEPKGVQLNTVPSGKSTLEGNIASTERSVAKTWIVYLGRNSEGRNGKLLSETLWHPNFGNCTEFLSRNNMPRQKLQIGDVFEVPVIGQFKNYFQFIAIDDNQLRSDVIKVFAEKHSLDEKPNLADIVRGTIAFYVHCVVRVGIRGNYWKKVGNDPYIGQNRVIFRASKDFGRSDITVSDRWEVWSLGKNRIFVGKLSDELLFAEPGEVFPPYEIVHRIVHGYYQQPYQH
jgi:RHS repeat-associated protein